MIGRAYRFVQILSIDIVIGVVILLRFFCVQFQVNPGWQVYVLLGAAVWLIYTADHLRDSEASKSSIRGRYVFHRKHKKSLMITSVSILISITPLIFFIPSVILLGGVVLGFFSFIYLLVQQRLSGLLSKELYVALVYSSGVLLAPMLLSWSFNVTVFILLFFLTFVNLIIFSWYEKEEDKKDGFKSIATQMKTDNLERMLILLTSSGLAVSFLSFDDIHVYFLVGFLVYASMILFKSTFRRNHAYRAIGDGVFLLPIIFEWL